MWNCSLIPSTMSRQLVSSSALVKNGLRETWQQSQPSSPVTDNGRTMRHPTISANKVKTFSCVLLHSLLVVAHIILLIVSIHHYEHAITTDINNFSATWVPLIVNVVSQVVATVCIYFQQKMLRLLTDKVISYIWPCLCSSHSVWH